MKAMTGVGLAFLWIMSATAVADIPRLLNYQARLDSGVSGSIDVTVRFYDAPAGGNLLFSETQSGVSAADGVFAVLIGAATVGGVPDAAFDASEVWIGVGIDGAPELTPRVQLGLAPFAGKAALAEGLSAGVTFTPILTANNAGDVELLDPAGNREFYFETDTFGSAGRFTMYRDTGTRSVEFLGGSSSGGQMQLFSTGGSNSFQAWAESSTGARMILRNGTSRTIDLSSGGGTNTSGSLEMWNDSNQQLIDLDAGTASLYLRRATGATTAQLTGTMSGTDGGGLALWSGDGTQTVTIDADEADGGAVLFLDNENGDRTIELDASEGGGNGAIRLRDNDNVAFALVTNDGATALFNNAAHIPTVQVIGDGNGGAGTLRMLNAAANPTLEIMSDAGFDDDRSQIFMYGAADTTTVELDSRESNGGLMRLNDVSGNSGIDLIASGNRAAGDVRLYSSANRMTLQLQGNEEDNGSGAGLAMYNNSASSNTRTVFIDGGFGGSSRGGAITLSQGDGVESILINGHNGDFDGGAIAVRDGSGAAAITLLGSTGRTITKVLEITGGSDLSEQFDVAADDGAVEPGMVVCIDPARPGKLKISRSAHDRTVAGVVSGANGVNTGFVMGQRGTLADGAHPIALTGRVWVHCDASGGPITPGDLLTTSSTPGHAMKVSDHTAAQGAIIGKAMTALDNGRGMVLVLVSLQ